MNNRAPRHVLKEDALAGKVALVTGAARGIGRAIAVELAHAGADVAINDLRIDDAGREVMEEITQIGRQVSLHAADVSHRSAVEAMIQAIIERHGHLDILINNAGMQLWEPFLEITDSVINRTLDVDLKGVILCGQIAARQMVRQGTGGHIVNISSVHAVHSIRTAAVYDAAKAGVQRLTGTMALELAEHDITVNAIGPGWMETPLAAPLLDTPEKRAEVNASIPVGRVGYPEEVGQFAAYLCTEAAAYITGAFLVIDGGYIIGR